MGFLAALFEPSSPMPWDRGEVPGRKQRRVEDAYDMSSSVEADYPEGVWAPPPNFGRGPESDTYPEPYQFKKRELVAACRQAMKLSSMGGRYPRPWTVNDEPTDYMAFPILPGQRLWDGGEPGRFRIIYHRTDGTFHRVVMHRYTTPLSGRENVGLGFCMADENCGQETSRSHERSAKLVKSPRASLSPANNSECHPLRQNPPVFRPVPWSPDEGNLDFHPLRQNPPVFKTVPWGPDDIGRSTWASPVFEIDSGTVYPDQETPPRLNSVPLPISNYDPPPLVKVKSAPGTLRRPSYGRPLPAELRTSLVRSPPTAMIKSMPNDIPPLPPLEISRNCRSSAVVPRQLSTILSPDVSQDGQFVATSPREARRPSVQPTPLVDQHGLFVKIPSAEPRRSSVARSPLVDKHELFINIPSAEPRRSSVATSPLVDKHELFMNIPSTEPRRSSVATSPLIDRNGVVMKSPQVEPCLSSVATSPTLDHRRSFARSPQQAEFPLSQEDMMPAPLDLKSSPSFKSTPTTPSINSDAMSPNVRLSRSPRATSYSFSNIERPDIERSPTVKQSPTRSPTIKSPAMSPQAFMSMHSPTMGYDPRLPIKSPRSPRISGFPYSSTQSVVLGQETPPTKSPIVGMYSSWSRQSPTMRLDPRLLGSPPVPQITFWTEQPEIRLSSHV